MVLTSQFTKFYENPLACHSGYTYRQLVGTGKNNLTVVFNDVVHGLLLCGKYTGDKNKVVYLVWLSANFVINTHCLKCFGQ
jgi:hypothetical protein